MDQGSLSYFQTEDGKPSLQSILSYHVAEGVLASHNILTNISIPTLYLDGAGLLDIVLIGDAVVLNGIANVKLANQLGNTGIVHIVDRVLSLPPPSLLSPPSPTSDPPVVAPPPPPTPPPVPSGAGAAPWRLTNLSLLATLLVVSS